MAHEAALRPSRDKSIDPAVWLEVVASILGAIVDQYDMSVGEDWWSKATALALEPSPKKARVERVSSSFKEALADQVSKDCRLTSTSSLLVGSVVRKEAKGDHTPSYDPRNQTKMRAESIYHYWDACRKAHSDQIRFHMSIDGVRVCSEESMPPIFIAPKLDGLMTFGPIQVWWHKCGIQFEH